MVERDMYRSSCTVLFQAILTQACRTILALCLIAKHRVSDARVVAMASSYVSVTEAPSLVEGMNMHTLLTALHFLCCEYHPYRACHHHNGELAAAVDAVRQNSDICQIILTALTEFISRKWRGDGVLVYRLLHCARLCDSSKLHIVPTVTTTTTTTTTTTERFEAAPLSLLLRVYPELGSTSAIVEVSCGCPHQWFRETLPAMLLTMSMEQHARMWRRSSLLLAAFLRWRQRHGMRLLCSLAAGSHPPALEISTHAPSTVPSEIPELSAARQGRCIAVGGEEKGSSTLPLQKSVQHDHSEQDITPPRTTTQPDASSSERRMDGATTASDALQDGEMLKAFIAECDKLSSMRIKRHSFLLWRDVRFDERRRVRRLLSDSMWRTKQRYWALWLQRLQRRREAKWRAFREEQCHALIETRVQLLVERSFVSWKNSFMVRRFRARTCGVRYLAMWRRAYIFSIHTRGKLAPLISHRAVISRCVERWRYAYRSRVADRICMRRYLGRIKEQVGRRSVFLLYDNVARLHERRFLHLRCMRTWLNAYRLRRLCAKFLETTGRSRLHHALTLWRSKWSCRCSGNDRMEAFLSMKQRRLVVLSFTHWRRKRYFRDMCRYLALSQIRSARRAVWTRWIQRAAFQRRIQRDRFALAVFAHQRFLLHNVWRLWRWRCTQREHEWFARRETAMLLRAQRFQDRQLLGTAWFTWRGKMHLTRRQGCNAALSPGCEKTPIGINRSFQPPNASIGGPPRRHVVQSRGLSVSFAELNRSPPRRDPLAALRAERVLLRGLDSSQWHSMAQSRLFNNSNEKRNTNKASCNGNNKWYHQRGGFDGEEVMIMLPSDVEDDISPSVDNSRVLL